jgi:DNA-binding transcriptional regulator YiaG
MLRRPDPRLFGALLYARRRGFRVFRDSLHSGGFIYFDRKPIMAKKRRSQDQLEEIDALVERLREFVRLSYMTAAEVARRMGVRDSAVYSWLQRESRPTKPEVISAFLKSVPTENGSGITPTGYEYREYKNWRGIPKPRRCPFCKKAKGEIRRRRGFLGVCPNCAASGPKRESYDEALAAWNGKGIVSAE